MFLLVFVLLLVFFLLLVFASVCATAATAWLWQGGNKNRIGADGEYDGDLFEPIVTVTEAAPIETWTNVVLPLSDFTTLTADGKIGQIIFDGGSGTETFYIDNIYFY